ncbi:flagellar protein FlaG [Undibacterium curvum]|uniref:Flagellar protein FlaG n=1 Tax=Undibacterium curvum TaxID=2762294 RepID=A0ABR7A737_9BURK|nr:flagellar protein FlaG [Undibacterium curvum]MBC3932718.1 flagellar protein FlaG [Undibacterium curvum]
MDIRSIGSSVQSGQLISEKVNISSDAQRVGNTNGLSGTTNAKTESGTAPDLSQVTKAVADINKTIQSLSQDLQFSVDKDSDKVVVKIIDQQTKQVLRQIPSEEALEISKSLDKLQGLLIKQQA